MPHPCGISYVVLGTFRYSDSTFIITFPPIYCNALSGPTSRTRRGSGHAVGQRWKNTVEKTLLKKHRRRQLLQYYDNNFHICDSREIHDFYGTFLEATAGKSK